MVRDRYAGPPRGHRSALKRPPTRQTSPLTPIAAHRPSKHAERARCGLASRLRPKTKSPSDRALSPDGLHTRYTPHQSHRRPQAHHPRRLRPHYDTSSALETATTRCAPSPIGAVAEVARDRSGDATTALGRSLDIVATLLGAGEQRRGREVPRTWTEEFRCSDARPRRHAGGTSMASELFPGLDVGGCEGWRKIRSPESHFSTFLAPHPRCPLAPSGEGGEFRT